MPGVSHGIAFQAKILLLSIALLQTAFTSTEKGFCLSFKAARAGGALCLDEDGLRAQRARNPGQARLSSLEGCTVSKSACHNGQSAALLSDSGLVMYFSTLPAPSSSVPCILTILTHLQPGATPPDSRELPQCQPGGLYAREDGGGAATSKTHSSLMMTRTPSFSSNETSIYAVSAQSYIYVFCFPTTLHKPPRNPTQCKVSCRFYEPKPTHLTPMIIRF